MIKAWILNLLFPEKCLFCGKILKQGEVHLCTKCSEHQPLIESCRTKFPFLSGWKAVWYYEEGPRKSLLRYKFGRRRSYARAYGRILSTVLLEQQLEYDLITWVPVSARRKAERGFDQVELIAKILGDELGMSPVPCLKKIRHTKAQSTIRGLAHRRANVLGAYTVLSRERIAGKRILLLDDIITTGSTLSECAKVLLTAGAKEVYGAAVAAARQYKQ